MTAIVKTFAEPSRWSGTLLIAGAAIGGGMLALPIQTAEAGFFLASLMLFVSWVFMTFTGLLLVESTLWLKEKAHFPSLTMALLGRGGKFLSLIVYLFMNYASLVAYTAGGAALLNHWSLDFFGFDLGHASGCVIFTVVFGCMIYLGAILIGRMNALFAIAMGLFYCILIFMGFSHIQTKHFASHPMVWKEGFKSLPLILASFSYQMIVPSVCSYLNYSVAALRKAVVFGTSIPCLVYFIWLGIVHGIVPLEGEHGLHLAFLKGSAATEPLQHYFRSAMLKFIADGFAFFALVTSYLGLSLALYDFISDVFRGFKVNLNRNITTFLSLFPSLILAIFFPRALLEFLDISGGFGDAILSGLIPIAMVWIGRYRRQFASDYRAPGGKWSLLLAGSFALFIFLLQIVKLT